MALLLCTLFLANTSLANDDFPNDVLAKNQRLTEPVDAVWSGHPVGFSLVTTQRLQVVAYYNSQNKQITLAARNLDSQNWFRTTLSDAPAVGWDSHNYLTLKIDADDYVHLSGNMHYSQMIYYRSSQRMTTASQMTSGFMQRIAPVLNATQELQVTYPMHLNGPRSEFLFAYRNHSNAGKTAGNWYLARYATDTRMFSSATGGPALFAWTNAYSAYPIFIAKNGYLHCFFIWRGLKPNGSIGHVEDNYRLSYMRTADLVHWTDAFGRPVALPITPGTTLTTVDDIPQLGGLISTQPTFDRDGIPMIAYHKYDANGKSQIYIARPRSDANTWRIAQITNSVTRWNFSGAGTVTTIGKADYSFVQDDPLDGLSTINIYINASDNPENKDPSSGFYIFDETTLTTLFPQTVGLMYTAPNIPICPSGKIDDDSDTPANTYVYVTPEGGRVPMGVRRSVSSGVGLSNLHYYLRWETLPSNNDLARTDGGVEISPPASDLLLYRTACDFPQSAPASPVPSTLNKEGVALGFMFKPSSAALSGAMTRQAGKGAFGNYLSSSNGYAETNVASWTFDIASGQGGHYALSGSTFSESFNGDSFYVQIDNGPLLDWHLTGYNFWKYEPISVGPTHALTTFALSANATHTLRVYAREPGAKLEYLWMSKVGGNKQPPSYGATQIGGGFTEIPDGRAVSGHAVGTAEGSTSTTGVAYYNLPVSTRGCYVMLGRTKAPNPSADSFYLWYLRPQDQFYGPAQTWNLPNSGTDWTWRTAQGGQNLLLEPGVLDLKVTVRESGSQLDAFILMYKGAVGANGSCS